MGVIKTLLLVYSSLVVTAIRDTVPGSTGDTETGDQWLATVYAH